MATERRSASIEMDTLDDRFGDAARREEFAIFDLAEVDCDRLALPFASYKQAPVTLSEMAAAAATARRWRRPTRP